MTRIRENGATSGVGVLATYAYDDRGNRTSVTFGNGVVQSFGYDAVSRLASLTNDLASTANDLSATFAYNPASQIASTTRTGDAYAFTYATEDKNGTPNGLNQLTAYGPSSLSHDAKGNVTAFGTKSFTYSSENLLLTGPGSTSLSYDPLMRLRRVDVGGAITNMVYDGLDRIAEYSNSVVQRRYIHGPGVDDPIVWYEGSATTDRRFLSGDERGNIVSVTDSSGTVLGINRYDEYGQPQSTNLGVFGYTGQAWLPSLGAWYYKARVYEPELGRFLQIDPIGTEGGPNLYAYVLNDPVNFTDSLGLQIIVTACRSPSATLVGNDKSGYTCVFPEDLEQQPEIAQRYDQSGVGGFTRAAFPTDDIGPLPPIPMPCPSAATAASQSKATNEAFASIGQSGFRQATSLTSEFARYGGSTDFSSGGWTPAFSGHSDSAYEHALPGSEFVIKVYIGDHNFGGANTTAITYPTMSLGHIAQQIPYRQGLPVNGPNASIYLNESDKCP